ncbi:MAG: (Fe-S)-binding protein [Burkholderiales bacterium]|nr:(Fe-S)-binding protein [Burkholderiales bacterium]
MLSLAKNAPQPDKDFASCSGCGLCLLVCPVWRRTHDLALTPLGRAKALQHGANAADIAVSVQSCTLCAACEPVCPEDIGLVEMTLDLRRRLPQPEGEQARMQEQTARPPAPQPAATAVLIPGTALRERPVTLARAQALLARTGKLALADDDGADIALALEAGMPVPKQRLERFLQPLRRARKIIVADGLLLRNARQWLPRAELVSLGVALSGLTTVRRALGASDLYVIEPRAYHADYQRLVKYYDGLRAASGCTFNLDLQRIAIPAAAPTLPQKFGLEAAAGGDDGVQARWILQGRNVTRIVLECMEDAAAFNSVSGLPVVHLADLADDGNRRNNDSRNDNQA